MIEYDFDDVQPIVAEIGTVESITAEITADGITADISAGGMIRLPPIEERYEGEYQFTPSDEAQTIEIGGLIAAENIVIRPIPNNYGLVTYNGFEITVS